MESHGSWLPLQKAPDLPPDTKPRVAVKSPRNGAENRDVTHKNAALTLENWDSIIEKCCFHP